VPLNAVPSRLYGTVHTLHGDFTGFVQWDRPASTVQIYVDGGRLIAGMLDHLDPFER
jgi:hypothetical protein